MKQDLPVARFTLATNERGFTTAEGATVPERTEWHNIVAWRGVAKFVENYLTKGLLVYVEGKLQTRSFTNQEGKTTYLTEIVAETIKILEKRTSSQPVREAGDGRAGTSADTVAAADKIISETPVNDDIPF